MNVIFSDEEHGAPGLRALTNPPAQEMVAYRAGDRADFLAGLLARLDGGDQGSLAGLTTGEGDDFTLALLDSWATTADVLTFYTERIANESYVRTAREQRSLRWLARLVGYEPTPGLAAATYLAFALEDTPGSPRRVVIPRGTQARSIPQEGVSQNGGELPQPQPYETLADFVARPEWNALRPRPTRRLVIGPSTRHAWFQAGGAAGTLRTGDMLLFRKGLEWAAARVTAVEPDPGSGRMDVRWSSPLPAGHEIPEDPQVFCFRQRAAIFGHNAADWRSLPDEAKATYLGAADVSRLGEVERKEWPQFVITAPKYPQNGKLQRVAAFPPTVESVAEAAHRAADAAFQAALMEGLAAFGKAIVLTMKATTDGLEALAGFGDAFTDQAGIVADTGSTIKVSLQDALKKLLEKFVHPSLEVEKFLSDENGIDWGAALNPLSIATNIVNFLAPAIEKPAPGFNIVDPIEEIVGQLVDLLNGPVGLFQDFGTTISSVATAVGKAVEAILALPAALAGLAGAFAVGQAVHIAMDALMEVNLPLPLTPELVAFVALYAAKLPTAALGTFNPIDQITNIVNALGNPDDALQQFNTLLVSLQSATEGSELTADELEDLAGAAADVSALLVGGAAVGSAAVGGAAVAVYAAQVSLVMMPYLVPMILTASALSAFVVLAGVAAFPMDGGQRAETAIFQAVREALEKDTQLRRALPALTNNEIDLDAVYPSVAPQSWVLLALPDGQAASYQVANVAEAGRSDFNLNGRVTRLTLGGAQLEIQDKEEDENEEDENPFLRAVRAITVFAQSEPLPLAEEPHPEDVPEQVNGIDQILLDRSIPVEDLVPDRPLIIVGRASTFPPKGELSAEQVVLKGTEEDEETGFTRLFLHRRAVQRYERPSVVIYGNVAATTHGETQRETLGSGNASQQAQQFTLRGKPLTHVPAPTTGGSASTLEVRVNRLHWHEADSPIEMAPDEQAYLVESSDDGMVTLRFGDGVNGSRLPTGQENVTATYRVGVGPKGNAEANRITLLTRHPPGVRSVTNPIPATGGTDPRSLLDVREVISSPARALERAVSLDDYALFALTFPDVLKALATWTWDAEGQVIFVTVAGQEGALLAADRLTALRDALREAGDPHVRFRIHNYRPACFRISGRLTPAREYEPALVRAAAEEALYRRFAFEERQFGQPVTLLQVQSTLHMVPGLVAVDIDVLQRSDLPDRLEPHLTAALPQPGTAGATEAAEILLLETVQLSLPPQ